MPFVTLGGVTLHYRHLAGEPGKRPIVFINSLGTDFRLWSGVTRGFAAHPTLVYDKRGHGLSDTATTPYTIADHVDDLVALLEHLKLEHVVVCGLSVGGLIALGLYERRPDLIDAIVFSCTAHKIGTADIWNQRIAATQRDGIASFADMVMERWFTPAFHTGRPADLAGYRNMLVRQDPAGYAGTCAAIRDADFTETARTIAVPTLCIAGDQDGSTPPDLVRSLAAIVPGARFELIDGSGHIPCVEQPAAMTRLLRGFVDALPPL